MTTHKTFKRGVRARMTKTGESYTSARTQLVRKADARAERGTAEVTPAEATPAEATPATTGAGAELTSEEAIRKATGRGWEEWFAILDAWGATERRHPEIARWLVAEHGVSGWWAQSVTVSYERARGLRGKHQMAAGYAVTAVRTIGVGADALLSAFTDAPKRRRWLPDAPLRRRPTRAAHTARFDWPEPASVLVVYVTPLAPDRSRVAVAHERLPDAETADRFKRLWRERLGALKSTLESSRR